MAGTRIGVDFDNTIACYDNVFLNMAKELDLVPSCFRGNKKAVRDAIRLTDDGELAWQKLQGQVYGVGIGSAIMFDGVERFLRLCREAGFEIFIVSHKTEFGHLDPDRVNLRDAALGWMRDLQFFGDEGFGILAGNVFFESTRKEKLARIAALDCTYFIDDLEEIFLDPEFPKGAMRILFSESRSEVQLDVIHCKTWRDIFEAVIGECG